MAQDIAPTQLADSRPQFDAPLRVAIPVNAPARIAKISHDQHIRTNAFSPAALSMTKKALPELIGIVPSNRKVLPSLKSSTSGGGGTPIVNMDHDAQIKTAIRDFQMLAFSSKRTGKKDVEASAYVSLGVIYDNQGNYLLAIENYKLYADICEEINDVVRF